MLSPSQLQFRLMAPEAQGAAVQRLALHGWDAQTISKETGLSEADVHRHLAPRASARIPPVIGAPRSNRTYVRPARSGGSAVWAEI
jgi:hypothetical protein